MYLLLIRGIPGCGKSTMGNALANEGWMHYENDMWRVLAHDGVFKFVDTERAIAQAWCIEQAEHALAQGHDVVVTNCFETRATMHVYYAMAAKHGATLRTMTMHTHYGSIHNMTSDAVQGYRDRWEVA